MIYPDFDRIRKASNMYYNSGLEKARIRDLSGAAEALKKSLQLNKRNTQARNLLGLVYYEMGEVVNALREWIISRHLEENETADRYISAVQENPSRLEAINQTIKKYNRALEYAKQGKHDLAILQLEKVVSLNPRFIRCYQLLALLYMEAGNNKKAAKCLSKALKIDKTNTITLKYKKELSDKGETVKTEEKAAPVKDRSILHEQENGGQVFTTSSYKEERFNFWPYVNFIIGAVLGVLVVYFLIVPTVKKQVASEYEEKFKTYSDDMASQDISSGVLERENEELTGRVETLTKELEDLKGKGYNEELYNNFYKAISLYIDDQKEEAAKQLADVKESALENPSAKAIYNKIKASTFEKAAEELAEEGQAVYNSGKYEEALKLLEDALRLDPGNIRALYFTGRAYHRQGEKEKAAEYYNKVINDYPDSDRAGEAKRRLRELGL